MSPTSHSQIRPADSEVAFKRRQTCEMEEATQKKCLCCCGFLGLASFISFMVVLTSYKFLQPDDQVVIKSGQNWEVINGPKYLFLSPIKKTEWRKATLLDASQYVMLRHRRTMEYRFEYGPQLLFLQPYDDVERQGRMIVLQMDEYIRINHKRTGQERLERGPKRVIVSTLENSTRGIEKAIMMDHDTAIVVQDRAQGLLRLVTTCTDEPGPYIPRASEYVVESRKRIYVLPTEVLIVRDENGMTMVYGNGTGPTTQAEGRCDDPSVPSAEIGVSFFLQPYSKIVRMQWSNFSTPPDPLDTIQQLAQQLPGSSSSNNLASNVRRRRTSQNSIVLQQTFQKTPAVWLVPGDYDPIAKIWTNRGSGQADFRNFIKSGTVRVTADSGSGTGANLLSIVGTTTTSLSFGSVLPRYYTICSLTRYTGSSKQRILTGGGTTSWYHGHWRGIAGVARYTRTIMTQTYRDEVNPDTEWVPMCGTNIGRSKSNILVGDKAVGVRYGGTPPPRLEVNTGTEKSSFAIGELLIWNSGLSEQEMRDAMDYLMRRLRDAKTYVDQIGSSLHAGPKRQLSHIDLRMQKSFYAYQARTNDNVRLFIEGCIFWRIVDARRMLLATADPEGDVSARSRSMLVAAVGNSTFSTFTSRYGDVIDQAFAANTDNYFFEDRGVELQSIELMKFEPLDNHTQFILQRIIEQTTNRFVQLERQRSNNDVRTEKLAADIQLESMRTELITTRSLNTRLEAEKAGAVEGSGLARLIRGYLEALKGTFASATERLALFRYYWTMEHTKRDVFHLFNSKAKAFLVRGNGTAMWLKMPNVTDM